MVDSVTFDMAAARICRLSVFQNRLWAFSSTHRSCELPTCSDEESGMLAREVPIDRFLGALRDHFTRAQEDDYEDEDVLQVQKVDEECGGRD